MCFDHDALPPELPADLRFAPMAGGAGAERLELTSSDGTAVAAALAESPGGGDVGVVIIPDVRGLYRFYSVLAERFAAAGHHAIAFDLYGRTAGAPPERDDEFDFMPHVPQTRPEGLQADLAAAADALREHTGVQRIVAVGFCFGAMQAFLAGATDGVAVDGVVGFYGALDGSRFNLPNAKDEARTTRVPVLALFGGADELIPAADRETFEANLRAAGVEHEIVVYDGAPHSFFDRKQDEFAEASADAWRRVLGFLGQTGAPTAA